MAEVKTELEEQTRLRKEQKKIKQLTQEIQILQATLDRQKEEITHFAEDVLPEARRCIGDDAPQVKALEARREKLLAEVCCVSNLPDSTDSVVFEEHKKRLISLTKQVRHLLDEEWPRDRQELQSAISLRRIDAEKGFLEFASGATVQCPVQPALPPLIPGLQEVAPDEPLQERWAAFCADVEPRLRSGLLDHEEELRQLYDAAFQIYSDVALTEEDKLAEIEKRHKAFLATHNGYDQEIARNRREREATEALHLEYAAYCALLDRPVRDFPEEASMEAVRCFRTELQREVKQLHEELRKKNEMEYVAKTVGEIMTELGHDVVASETLAAPNRNIIHNMYRFDDDMVVNVFTSDNGGVMFEVSGVSEEKRPATSLEKLKIKEGMERFCDKYPWIKEKLAASGLALGNENLKEPDVSYARLIPLKGENGGASFSRVKGRTRTLSAQGEGE
ncbi:hypothetical protein [Heliomicrobium gestii]|uniref:hypothetical protein n=1 Tax=Heliomicrobium gestii TaxID=2699 RepID=UPI001A9BF728|nr:hypothetical protein [Heliomicrobium gestii]